MRKVLCFTRPLALLLALALPLCACMAPEPEQVSEQNTSSVSEPESVVAPEIEEPPFPSVYTPPAILSAEDTARVYFEQMYLSYINMRDIDLSSILYMSHYSTYNSVVWGKLLNQRRRLIYEAGLCHVETEAFPYSIRFITADELADGRLEYWPQPLLDDGLIEAAVHFTITGEPGRVYPPWMAINAQHTMLLRYTDGVWRIRFHYYPGSIRKYPSRTLLRLPSDEEMLRDLLDEFSGDRPGGEPPAIPDSATTYDGEKAAEYALRHTESPNPDFYAIDDFMGNCANFTSQCVWGGFSSGGGAGDIADWQYMTNQWYAGSGGGTPAWENVEHFWNRVTLCSEMGGQILGGVNSLQPGDIIQTSSYMTASADSANSGGQAGDRFNHSLVVVDADKLLLAQNSPGCFVYYSDLVNVGMRYVRPVYVN